MLNPNPFPVGVEGVDVPLAGAEATGVLDLLPPTHLPKNPLPLVGVLGVVTL